MTKIRVEKFGDAELWNGDCREILHYEDSKIDFMFTDPPYGHNNNDGDLISSREAALGKAKAGKVYDARPISNDDPEETKKLIDWLFNDATKLLVKGGCLCCCCAGSVGKDVAMAEWSQKMFAVPHLEYRQLIIWDKGPMGMGWHFRRSYEVILEAQKRGAPCKWYDETNKIENVIRPGDYGIHKIIPGKKQHPTEKPPELAAHFIRLHTLPGELVCDPFAGSFSTGIACVRLRRKFLGIELDPHWFDVGCRKIEEEVRQRESGEDLMEALFGN